MIALPEIFLQQMQYMLQPDEFAEFCKTYQEPTVRGLRLNTLKTSNIYSELSTVPWCATGRYYTDDIRPAKSIYHHAGLFYIQEPSAMCPVEVLFFDDNKESTPDFAAPQLGLRVLDLCAAPGGKSAQIAGHLQGKGLLMSNDASPTRSRALVKNLERMGVTNAVVTTEMPKKLSDRFPEFFDRILVDAPCSGEGMFRRDSDAVKAYTANKPDACTEMQRDILLHAAKMLKPGGRLVYSSCTFNMKENEHMILQFCENHPDFTPVAIDHATLGISTGLGKLPQAGRIFPHKQTGEGHFVALLEKGVGDGVPDIPKLPQYKICGASRLVAHSVCCSPKRPGTPPPTETPAELSAFLRTHLTTPIPHGVIVSHGANLYLQPEPLNLSGIRVARSGWFLGEVAKGRFTPSHALAMGLCNQGVRFSAELSEENAARYLRGESLDVNSVDSIFESTEFTKTSKPWVLMCYNGYPLGWAKLVQGRLKNNLPVGLVTS